MSVQYLLAMWGLSIGPCEDFVMGEKLLARALSFAVELDDLSTIGWIEYMYGCLLLMKGDGLRGAHHFQKAIKYMEERHTVLAMVLRGVGQDGHTCSRVRNKIAVDLTEKGLKMHTDLGMAFYSLLVLTGPSR